MTNPVPWRRRGRPRRLDARLLAAAMPLVLVAACAGEGETGAGPSPGELAGDWALSHGSGPEGDVPIVDGHRPTLTIEDEDWGGSVCNHYGATVELAGDRVTVRELFWTEMACVDEGVMGSEAAYLDAFGQVDHVERVGGHLVLRGEDVELVYAAVEPETDAALIGTTWRLESLVHGEGSDAAVSQATSPAELQLAEDGALRASTGCRRLRGPYHLDGGLLDLTEVTIEGSECDDEQLADQDEQIERVLLGGTAIRIAVEGQRLELSAPGGRGLHYRAD